MLSVFGSNHWLLCKLHLYIELVVFVFTHLYVLHQILGFNKEFDFVTQDATITSDLIGLLCQCTSSYILENGVCLIAETHNVIWYVICYETWCVVTSRNVPFKGILPRTYIFINKSKRIYRKGMRWCQVNNLPRFRVVGNFRYDGLLRYFLELSFSI